MDLDRGAVGQPGGLHVDVSFSVHASPLYSAFDDVFRALVIVYAVMYAAPVAAGFYLMLSYRRLYELKLTADERLLLWRQSTMFNMLIAYVALWFAWREVDRAWTLWNYRGTGFVGDMLLYRLGLKDGFGSTHTSWWCGFFILLWAPMATYLCYRAVFRLQTRLGFEKRDHFGLDRDPKTGRIKWF